MAGERMSKPENTDAPLNFGFVLPKMFLMDDIFS